MATSRSRRRHRATAGTLPDDLYTWIETTVPPEPPPTPPCIGRPRKHRPETWTVSDDWPEQVPVTEAEVLLFEAWFDDVLDELFGPVG
jgi:hypothetical protein